LNIVFICGKLAPGKCGVGDYTRKLAAELTRQGHRASAIAVRDFFVTTALEEWQEDGGTKVRVLRLPADMGLADQTRRIQLFLDLQGADCLSLQYVPFSFHRKGLPWAWNAVFEKIGREKRWHIMFHELWLGLSKDASIKEICWGEAQRQIVLNLIKKLNPSTVHTQARVYKSVLARNGIPARQLPLFSNIDSHPVPGSTRERSNSDITFGVFGGIYETNKKDRFLLELDAANQRNSRRARFLFLGRNGKLKESWLGAIKQRSTLSFEDRGEMEADAITYHLSKADIGLAFTPLPLLEKSGSVACYWASGLPVLTVADDWRPRNKMDLEYAGGAANYQPGHLQNFLESYSSLDISSKDLSEIAHQFVRSVSTCKSLRPG
jgi:hypothetical protein